MTWIGFVITFLTLMLFWLILDLCAYLTAKTKKTDLEIEHLEQCKKQLSEAVETYNRSQEVLKPMGMKKDD